MIAHESLYLSSLRMSRELFTRLRERSRLNALIRSFFDSRDMLEVSTPIMSSSGNTDINVDSFESHYSGPISGGPKTRWLRTSPEFALKRLMAAGIGDVFEIGPVFRNGEFGPRHNPEFTMLEWYREGFDQHRLMNEVAAFISVVSNAFGRPIGEIGYFSYRELYLHYLQIDVFTAVMAELERPLRDYSINLDQLSRDDLLDLLRTHCIEPQINADAVFFVYDFPASQAALAKIRLDDIPVAERFELYLGPIEMANGYHELGDPIELRARFERDQQIRAARGQSVLCIDENLLSALPKMPACAGVALGVERLHQWLIRAPDLSVVMPLRFDQA